MKKHLLSLLVFFIGHSVLNAQCTGTFSCNIIPTAAANGKVIMYRKSISGAMMDSVTYKNVTTPSFTLAIPDSGRYILKFIPSSPLYQVSYSDTAKSWDKATIYNNPCFNSFTALFFAQPYATLVGSGTGAISGKVVEGQKYGQKNAGITTPGTPIGGITVKGGKNPGGQLFAQTTTDNSGNYLFNNLPAGDYFVLVDIPGLDTASTHHVILNNNQVSNLGFTVDSLKIVPSLISSDVSVAEINAETFSASVFPNPASTQFKLQYSLLTPAFVKIEIFDLLGKNIKIIQPLTSQAKGDYKLLISTSDLKPGIYFVKQLINDHELLHKLMIVKE